MKRITSGLRETYSLLKREKFFRIIGIACVIILFGALALYLADRYYETKEAGSLMPSTGL